MPRPTNRIITLLLSSKNYGIDWSSLAWEEDFFVATALLRTEDMGRRSIRIRCNMDVIIIGVSNQKGEESFRFLLNCSYFDSSKGVSLFLNFFNEASSCSRVTESHSMFSYRAITTASRQIRLISAPV